MTPVLAPHSRVAFSTRVSRTGCEIKSRAADDLEDFAGGGLLLEGLISSRLRACTSSNSRVFSMAMTAWSANVFESLTAVGEGPQMSRPRRLSPQRRFASRAHGYPNDCDTGRISSIWRKG